MQSDIMPKRPVGRPEKAAKEKRDKLRVTAPMTESEKKEITEALEILSKQLSKQAGQEIKLAEGPWAREALLAKAREILKSKR